MTDPDGREPLADTHQRVINRIFSAGLSLTAVLSLKRLDAEMANRLNDAIDELDTALRELRHAAFGVDIRSRDVQPRPADIPEPSSNGHRRLNRLTSDQVVAYATGRYNFYGAADHAFWAHETDGLLLAAHSGTPIARRDGNIFYDLDTNTPLYYEQHLTEPPPGPPGTINP